MPSGRHNVISTGSPIIYVEWNYMIDLMEMLSGAIKGQDVSFCLETTLRVYLEGRFNLLARSYALAGGRPISYVDAKQRAAADVEWGKEIDFIKSLLSSMRAVVGGAQAGFGGRRGVHVVQAEQGGAHHRRHVDHADLRAGRPAGAGE
jgi:hypothetical protein